MSLRPGWDVAMDEKSSDTQSPNLVSPSKCALMLLGRLLSGWDKVGDGVSPYPNSALFIHIELASGAALMSTTKGQSLRPEPCTRGCCTPSMVCLLFACCTLQLILMQAGVRQVQVNGFFQELKIARLAFCFQDKKDGWWSKSFNHATITHKVRS